MPLELTDPISWLCGARRDEAVLSPTTYLASYTGRLIEPLAARSSANRFEADDIVAVSCLSVTVPAEVAGWLLVGEGQELTARLLADMDVDRKASLRLHDLTKNAAAVELASTQRAGWCRANDRQQADGVETSSPHPDL